MKAVLVAGRRAGAMPLIAACALLALPALAQSVPDGEWRSWGNDTNTTKFSPLDEITPANVATLKQAWKFDHSEAKARIPRNWQVTPLVIDGVMYFSTPSSVNSVVALDPTTGKLLWKWGVEGGVNGRGLAYWPGDRTTPARLVFVLPNGMLQQLDARTGQPSAVGAAGQFHPFADLPADKRPPMPNPVAIYRDVAIVGSISPGTPRGVGGDIRAVNLRTGKPAWTFHTVPHKGEKGFESWTDPASVADRTGNNVWSMFTIDPKSGVLYAPIASPGALWYGGDRPGDNLYGNSIVALNAATGKPIWHYQLVHHDINDYDATAAPTLLDVKKDGRTIPAVVSSAKTGMIFFLDRRTGKPIFGVDEKPIFQSTTPGEKSSPTQPFVRKPAMLGRNSMTRADLTQLSPASNAFCTKLYEEFGGDSTIFKPVTLAGSIQFPGSNGGMDWGGVTYSPKLGMIFVNLSNLGILGKLEKQPDGSALPYDNVTHLKRFVDQDKYPCQVPPWGELAAVDVNTAEIKWKVPLGSYRELEAQGKFDWGAPNLGGSMVTAGGVLFIGATNDRRFRAFDAKSGKKLWQVDLEGSVNAVPMSFRGKDGHQYVVLVSSGPGNWRNVGPVDGDSANSVIAYRLP